MSCSQQSQIRIPGKGSFRIHDHREAVQFCVVIYRADYPSRGKTVEKEGSHTNVVDLLSPTNARDESSQGACIEADMTHLRKRKSE